MLIKKRLLNFTLENQDILLVFLIVLLKVLMVNGEIGLKWRSVQALISSMAILSVLSGFFLLIPYLARAFSLVLFDLMMSVVLWADSLFFRIYHSVITIPVLLEIGMVKGVSSSIKALISRMDFWLFADFLVLIPYLIRKQTKYTDFAGTWPRRLGQFTIVLLICCLPLSYITKRAAANFSLNEYTGVSWDTAVLRNLGVVNFHLFDLYSYVKQNQNKSSLTAAAPALKSWMDDHRHQTTHNLSGIAKGKNLIIVQMEALQDFLIGRSVNGQQVTPNLNRLVQRSLYFDNYFMQIGQGNTSDAEFMTLNSLYPAPSGSYFVLKSKNTYQSLPMVLKATGYQGSFAFHANTPDFWNRDQMYKAEGFSEFFHSGNFFKSDETVGMGLSDQSMFQQVATKLKQFKQPYFSFVITLSGHYPYDIPAGKQELNLEPGRFSEIFSNYLHAQHYADKALGDFINQLEHAGILDNSVLVVYGDHAGTGWTNQDLQQILALDTTPSAPALDELNKVPLLIHLPGNRAAGVRHISGGQMDLYPTLLNLLGINNTKTYFLGQDLLNAQHGFSAFRVWLPDGSFATDNVLYVADWNGKFEDGTAYDRQTGQPVDLQNLKSFYDKARWELSASDLIMQTDGLPQLIQIDHVTNAPPAE